MEIDIVKYLCDYYKYIYCVKCVILHICRYNENAQIKCIKLHQWNRVYLTFSMQLAVFFVLFFAFIQCYHFIVEQQSDFNANVISIDGSFVACLKFRS